MFTDFRLEVFVAVARTGSFTAASRALGVSQPAVSQNIGQLEEMIGTKLFERNRGSVTLTDAGRQFDRYARKILYWYERVQTIMVEKTENEPEPTRMRLSDGTTLEVSPVEDELRIKVL